VHRRAGLRRSRACGCHQQGGDHANTPRRSARGGPIPEILHLISPDVSKLRKNLDVAFSS
jgi:hypothetical protein